MAFQRTEGDMARLGYLVRLSLGRLLDPMNEGADVRYVYLIA